MEKGKRKVEEEEEHIWDDEKRELYTRFPQKIIDKFVKELVSKKLREEELLDALHRFYILTLRRDKPLTLRRKALKAPLSDVPRYSDFFHKDVHKQPWSVIDHTAHDLDGIGDFRELCSLIGNRGFCGLVGKDQLLDNFHLFRSLRHGKDLQEVTNDPIEKEVIHNFCEFCAWLQSDEIRSELHTDSKFQKFRQWKNNVKIESERFKIIEWHADWVQFGNFGSSKRKRDALQNFRPFFSLFPDYYELDWDQIEQLARAGPIFGDATPFCADDIHAYFAKEKSSEKDSSQESKYCRVDVGLNNAMTDQLSPSTLHVSFVNISDPKEIFNVLLHKNSSLDHLQTLLLLGDQKKHVIHEIPRELFFRLRHLNVLDLSWTSITELPSSFAILRSLKYLDVSGTRITRLPSCICSFKDMQTLRLRDCFQLYSLPKDLSRLTKLRHLDINQASPLTSMPPGMRSLIELRRLPVFIVGKDEGCNIDELTDLKALQGSLSILRLENVLNSLVDRDFKTGFIENKHLEKLELEWTANLAHEKGSFRVLQFLTAPADIKILRVHGYIGESWPISWFFKGFLELTTVTLSSFRCPVHPRLGELPQLQTLHMSDFRNNQEIFYKRPEYDSILFPRLKTLVLHSFYDLEKWVDIKDGDFPLLTDLMLVLVPSWVVFLILGG